MTTRSWALLGLLAQLCGCHLIFPFGVASTDAGAGDSDSADAAVAEAAALEAAALEAAADDQADLADLGPPLPTHVWTGEAKLSSSKAVVPLSGLGPLSRAFVLCSFRVAASHPSDVPTCQLEAGGLVIQTGSPSGSFPVVRWHVMRHREARVQRGGASFKKDELKLSVPLDKVDLKRTFVVVTSTTASSNDNDDPLRMITASLVGSTALELERMASGVVAHAEWQVVELVQVTVQHKIAALGSVNTSVTPTITKVDSKRTFVLFSTSATASMGGIEAVSQVRGRLQDGTHLLFDRLKTGGLVKISWFAVELTDGSTVQASYGDLPSSITPSHTDTLAPTVSPDRSFAIGSANISGDISKHLDVVSFTAEIAGKGAQILLERIVNTTSAGLPGVAWQVVELAQ